MNLDTPIGGAIKGAIQGTTNYAKNYAKKNKLDAAKMGIEFAKSAGITVQNGTVFAIEFLKAIREWTDQETTTEYVTNTNCIVFMNRKMI